MTGQDHDTTTTRCGFVAIVGAPNAGKSTLLNRMAGTKLSIVSPKAQTTRFRVLGILMRHGAQILLVDTPGIFQPRRRLDRAMAHEDAQHPEARCLRLGADNGQLGTRHAVEQRGLARIGRADDGYEPAACGCGVVVLPGHCPCPLRSVEDAACPSVPSWRSRSAAASLSAARLLPATPCPVFPCASTAMTKRGAWDGPSAETTR